MVIIGHHKERARLKLAVEGKSIAQSYLFSGPDGIGKSLCAMEFACALVGEPEFDVSGSKEAPFDIMVIRPECETKRGVTKMKNIPAEEIRDAIRFLGQYPVSGAYRVVIIEDAHKLSVSAQNVLLKTLEEPNSSAVIILVTHEVGGLLPTVMSRMQHIRFGFVTEQEIREGVAVSDTDVPGFFFSLGRPGIIVSALHDPGTFVGDKESLSSLFRLSTLSLSDRLYLAEKMAVDVPRTIRLIEWWLPGLHASAHKANEPRATARFFTLFENIERTLGLLKTTQSNARLLLENLFLSV
jgi:hypothetical protein